MSNDNSNQAFMQVVSILTKLAGVSTGLVIISIFCGWKMQSAYLNDIGAPWVLNSLGTSFIAKQFSSYIVAFLFSSLFSFAFYSIGSFSIKSLRRLSLATLAIGVVFYSPIEYLFDMSLDIKYRLTATGVILIALSSGHTMAEVIARLAENKMQWDGYHFFLLFIVFWTFFYQTPEWVGRSKAALDMSAAESPLPSVMVKDGNEFDNIKLLFFDNNSFYLMSIDKENNKSFMVVNHEKIEAIKETP
ncbi:hypothetical protein [Vreelandella populi]|uniref:hypothetical protein n=1 Tax=Vreelandella populi TaxID=2498858 RepID=UPI000F8F011D|nr:hypothetical protein [Halomonas populi]RUR51431.1 hypothetical protein ELY40_16665 [Halomonas populi]